MLRVPAQPGSTRSHLIDSDVRHILRGQNPIQKGSDSYDQAHLCFGCPRGDQRRRSVPAGLGRGQRQPVEGRFVGQSLEVSSTRLSEDK